MQEREQMERQLRRAKIQCLILGTAALLLGGIQIWQTSHKEKKTAEVGYRIQTAHPDRGEQESEDGGTDLLLLVNKEHALPEDFQVQLH